ncbi:hypothetical protein ACIQ7D_35330 [Streptomyces sp. NPDC096310]|uniref:hypothetical protein n=1 Tax=Streptomyces sp. NPDC096310 TaxID=3366082 RepID=UPI0038119A32
MSERKAQVWAGVDAGKGHHWAAVVDETGAPLWSKKDGVAQGDARKPSPLGGLVGVLARPPMHGGLSRCTR